jgi:membrane fusion protein (multidrug efflux system)
VTQIRAHIRVHLLWSFTGLLACFALLNTSAGAEEAAPITVAVASIAPVFEEIPLTGTVTARRVSQLSSQVQGLVAEILVDDGYAVEAGDVLVRLDKVLAEIDLTSSRAALEESEARHTEAIRQRNEAADLVDKNHIASTTYEGSIAEVNINQASVKRLRAELRRQSEIVDRHTIRAPFSGVIGDKLVEVGQWVETGTALVELVEIDVLRVDVPVPQVYFTSIGIGTPVSVRFDSLPHRSFDAKVTMKIPISSPAARTFPIRIEMENAERLKTPGMSARVSVVLREDRDATALQLPRDAIVHKPDGSKTVWVINERDGLLHAKPLVVQTGRTTRGRIEILGGEENPGDRVVLHGNEILQPDQRVRIVEMPPRDPS